jgi:hypothetical protein
VPPGTRATPRQPEELEYDDRAYHPFFLAVSQRFAAHDAGDVQACCREGRADRIVVEYCSAATALLLHENDDAAFLETMPSTRARVEASNELDLVLSDFEVAGPEPFALYFRRAWQLAHAGSERAVEGFVVMFENSSGIFAELAEGGLCPVLRAQPALFGRLRVRHRAAVDEMHAHCPLRN